MRYLANGMEEHPKDHKIQQEHADNSFSDLDARSAKLPRWLSTNFWFRSVKNRALVVGQLLEESPCLDRSANYW